MSEYIKREDALHELSTSDFLKDVPDCERGIARARARLVINSIPTADVEPVMRGEWVQDENGKWICSVCNCLAIGSSYDGESWQYNTIRCPNCGAHMERSGSSE